MYTTRCRRYFRLAEQKKKGRRRRRDTYIRRCSGGSDGGAIKRAHTASARSNRVRMILSPFFVRVYPLPVNRILPTSISISHHLFARHHVRCRRACTLQPTDGMTVRPSDTDRDCHTSWRQIYESRDPKTARGRKMVVLWRPYTRPQLPETK